MFCLNHYLIYKYQNVSEAKFPSSGYTVYNIMLIIIYYSGIYKTFLIFLKKNYPSISFEEYWKEMENGDDILQYEYIFLNVF